MILNAINPVAFNLGPLSVRWYGIFIASAIILALVLASHEAKKVKISPDDLFDMVLWALPFAIIGARIYYVVFRWSYFQKNPSEIIQIWNGGIAIYGGLIAAGIVVYLFCRSRLLPVWLVLDIAAPTVMLAQAIGRWGNFINQEAYGAKTTLAFLQNLHLPNWLIQQMFIDGAYRQPTFLYESSWNLLGFVLIMLLRHRQGLFKQGEIFLSYILWYSFGRAFIEGMRTDSLMFFDVIRVSQLLSVCLFIAALVIWFVRRKKGWANRDYLAGAEFFKK